MTKFTIPGTVLNASTIGLGTSSFGSGIDISTSMDIMDRWIQLGGNLIDTAHAYGSNDPDQKSPSEEVIGQWLEKTGLRDEIILCTKGGHPRFDTKAFQFGPSRLSVQELDHDLHMSLQSLRTDRIDIYFLHRDDLEVPVSVLLDWLEEQVSKGCIRYYGCSNWTVPRIVKAKDYARQKGYTGFICNQAPASLAVLNSDFMSGAGMTWLDDELMSFHKSSQMCLISAMTLANGYFHKYLSGKDIPAFLKMQYENEANKRISEGLTAISSAGIPVNSILYHFIRDLSFPTISLMGFRSPDQLESLVTDIETPVPESELNKLRMIREHYAKEDVTDENNI